MTPVNPQRLRTVAALALTALLPTQMGGCPELLELLFPPAATVQDITPEDAFALIQAHQGDPNFIILDVRTADEYATGYIENAINMCVTCAASFADDVQALDKTATYLVYCKAGGRSGNATGIMIDVGFTNVYNMLGGIDQWQADGYPVVLPE